MRRDLELMGESVGSVRELRWGLERARSGFLEYSSHVGHFKVRFDRSFSIHNNTLLCYLSVEPSAD